MDSKLPFEEDGQRVFAVVLATGDEVLTNLGEFVRRNRISAAQLTAVGAFSDVVLKYFDWEGKQYRHIPVDEQVEVASLVGDVALDPEAKPVLHIHVVVGRRDGGAVAGHLGQAHVRPTLEVIINESPAWSSVKAIVGQKLAAGLLDRYLARKAYSGQQSDEPALQRDNNLVSPVAQDEAAHGRFDAKAKPDSSELWIVEHTLLLAVPAIVIAAVGLGLGLAAATGAI